MKRIAAALLFAFALLAWRPCPAIAQEQQITLTVEAADGALLVRGPQAAVSAARADLDGVADETWTVAQVRTRINKQFPDHGIELLSFDEAGAAGKGVSRVEASVRRALILGLLPPVEGLPGDAAAEVLNAAGMRSMARSEWDALSGGEQLVAAARGARPLAVLSGTKPNDAVIIIYLESGEHAGESK
jgi:hypothetical protein